MRLKFFFVDCLRNVRKKPKLVNNPSISSALHEIAPLFASFLLRALLAKRLFEALTHIHVPTKQATQACHYNKPRTGQQLGMQDKRRASHCSRWRNVYLIVLSEGLAFLLPLIVTIILSLLVRAAFERVVDDAKDDLGKTLVLIVSRLMEDFVTKIFAYKDTVQATVELGWYSGDTGESGSREWADKILMPFSTLTESQEMYHVLPGPSRKVVKVYSDREAVGTVTSLGVEERVYVNETYQYRRSAELPLATAPLTVSFGERTEKAYDPWQKEWYMTAVAAEEQAWNGPVLSASSISRDEQIIELLFRAQWPAGSPFPGQYSAFKYKMHLDAVSQILKRLQNRLTRNSIVTVTKNDGKVLGLLWFGVESSISFSSGSLSNATDGEAADVGFRTTVEFPYPLNLVTLPFISSLSTASATITELDDEYLVFAQRIEAGNLDWNIVAIVDEKNIIPELARFTSMLTIVFFVSVALYTLRGVVSFVIVVYRIRSGVRSGTIISPLASPRQGSKTAPDVVASRDVVVMNEVNLSSSSSSSSLASTYSASSGCAVLNDKHMAGSAPAITYKGKSALTSTPTESNGIVMPIEKDSPRPGFASQPRLSARLAGMESNATLISSPSSTVHLAPANP